MIMSDYFGIPVKVGDIVYCDAPITGKNQRVIAKVTRISEKQIYVKLPAYKWNVNSPPRFNINLSNTTHEWGRTFFIKLSDEQINFARENLNNFYGDI